jgi:malonate-semialdehyde dehydrogenase (acetylating) / methylmalonate-semialdehyde dehydrogenase
MSTAMPTQTADATEVRTLRNYVGGQFVEAETSEHLDVTEPATGALLARVPLSSTADLDAAVRAAQEAFPAWRRTPTIERARRLFTLRQALVENQEQIARLITQDMGKTLPDAFAEVGRAIEMVECASAVPTTMQGRNLENVATNVDCETYRQPIGVFGAICPFNFPAMVPMWFLPFAVGCGNTFVLKPSEQVPLAQEAIFKLIHELELLPPGVINLVHGGREVVEGICDHPGIAGVSFVGSATVAKLVYERSARAGKRVQALGGAKNHMVVMPDAVIDKTVENIIGSSFGAAGQRCMAGSVLVTVGSAHERVVPALIAAAEKLRVGNGLEKGVGVGPLVSSERRDIVRSWIDKGAAEGASVVLDGREENGDNAAGAFVGPTIMDDVTPDMDVAREEIFGPVLSVVKVDTLEEAIAVVNGSRYGNGSSIFTESGAVARRYRHDCDAGMIGVNIGFAAPVAFFPFSGWKDSFLGDLHAHGGDAIDFYTRKTTVTSRWYSDGETGKFFVE